MDVIEGQITYRRAVSKKLVFYDVYCTGLRRQDAHAAAEHVQQPWVEVVVKLGTFGSSIQDIKDLRDTLKLGDVVTITGTFEQSHVLQAVSVTVVQAWKAQHPGVAFKPQPAAPQHKATAHSKQQQQQQQQQQLDAHAAADAHAAQLTAAAATAQAAAAADDGASVAQADDSAVPRPAVAAAAVARIQQPQLAVCKFWVNSGRCVKGAACPYAHVADGHTSWVKRRRGERQLMSSHLGFSHDADSAAAKGKRAQLFASWLVDTYGKEALNAGAGVLDIAGGAGGITFELCMVHGIRCTLVDPRPLKLNKQQHQQLKTAGKAALLQVWTAEQLKQGDMAAELRQLAQHKQQQLQQTHTAAAAVLSKQPPVQDSDWATVSQQPGLNKEVQQQGMTLHQPAAQQQQQQWRQHRQQVQCDDRGVIQPQQQQQQQQHTQERQLQHHKPVDQEFSTVHPPAVCFQQVQGWFGPELWSSGAFQQLFGSCSLVLGLHPDEATEPIVDYALEAGVPFAVMPCCVFPRMFPDRRVSREGQLRPVESYADLVEYLAAKGQGGRMC